MPRNPLIIKCDMFEEELMEIDSSGFEETGSITLILVNKYQSRQTSFNGDPIVDINTTRTSDTISQEIQRLCSEDFTEYWVSRLFQNLEVNPRVIDQVKDGIVSRAVDIAIDTRDRGLKQFGLVADIEVTYIRETVQDRNRVLPRSMMESREQRLRRRRRVLIASRDQELLRRREQELELLRRREQELLRRRVSIASREQELLQRVLLQSMEERKLKRNPASKSSIEKLKRGHFESGGVGGVMKNCVVCLDDFEIGSKVIWMPCSHMFHQGCLLPWLKKSKSCPLCRLELTD